MKSNMGKSSRPATRPPGGDVAKAACAAASMARQLPESADISIAVRTGGHVLSVTPDDKKNVPKEELFHTPPKENPRVRRTREGAADRGHNRPGRSYPNTSQKFCATVACGKGACGDCKDERGNSPLQRPNGEPRSFRPREIGRHGIPKQEERMVTRRHNEDGRSPHRRDRDKSKPRPRCGCLVRVIDEGKITFDPTTKRLFAEECVRLHNGPLH